MFKFVKVLGIFYTTFTGKANATYEPNAVICKSCKKSNPLAD